MRNSINSAFAATALVAFAIDNVGASADVPVLHGTVALPEAKQPVPSAETVAAITSAETADRKAKAAALKAKRDAKAAATAKPSGKPGKAATAAKPVKRAAITEAKPDLQAARAERIAADRNELNALYATFESNRASVPVKPLSAFKPARTSAHPNARRPSERQAAAIAVAFAAAKKQLKAGTSVNRVFEHAGVRSCIENGVLRDAVSSGLITVSGDSPETEKLTLTSAKAATTIIGLIGSRATKAGNLSA